MAVNESTQASQKRKLRRAHRLRLAKVSTTASTKVTLASTNVNKRGNAPGFCMSTDHAMGWVSKFRAIASASAGKPPNTRRKPKTYSGASTTTVMMKAGSQLVRSTATCWQECLAVQG